MKNREPISMHEAFDETKIYTYGDLMRMRMGEAPQDDVVDRYQTQSVEAASTQEEIEHTEASLGGAALELADIAVA